MIEVPLNLDFPVGTILASRRRSARLRPAGMLRRLIYGPFARPGDVRLEWSDDGMAWFVLDGSWFPTQLCGEPIPAREYYRLVACRRFPMATVILATVTERRAS
jgi:hypothetical protein